MPPQLLFQIIFNGLVLGFAYVLIAAGLTLVLSIMDIVNFAHGELYMLGAFGVYVFAVQLGLSYPLAFLLAVLLVGGLGIVMERFFFRPFGADVLPSFIVALGFVLVFQTGMLLIFGASDRSIPTVFPGTIQLFGAIVTVERAVVVAAAIAIMLALYLFLTKTKAGQGMRAVAQDADAAALQGIDVGHMRSLCMFVGSVLAAAAGALLGPVFYVGPYIGAPIIMKTFIIVIVGGLGSVPGAVLGGLLLGFIESFGTTLADAPLAAIVAFSLLIVVLLVRPRGLLGHA